MHNQSKCHTSCDNWMHLHSWKKKTRGKLLPPILKLAKVVLEPDSNGEPDELSDNDGEDDYNN